MLAPSLSLSFLLSLFLSLSLSISLFLSVGDFMRQPSPSRELLFSVCADCIHACFFQKHRSHTAAHCSTLQHIAVHCNTLQHPATPCNTLHYTATHCNTLPERLTRSLSKVLSSEAQIHMAGQPHTHECAIHERGKLDGLWPKLLQQGTKL